jgi:hypothetical protein
VQKSVGARQTDPFCRRALQDGAVKAEYPAAARTFPKAKVLGARAGIRALV